MTLLNGYKRKLLFVAEIVEEKLDLNILGRPDDLGIVFFYVWIDFKTWKKLFWKPFIGRSTLKDRYSKIYSVFFVKQRGQIFVGEFGNTLMSEKAKIVV